MIKVVDSSLNILNMKTRIPFKYGIATLSSLPHLFVELTVDVGGEKVKGIAADGLAPKWFTKNPATSFKEDIDEMLLVINKAVEVVKSFPPAQSAFQLWFELNEVHKQWALDSQRPLLLASLGVSLVERALIDAVCKISGKSFYEALIEGDLGFYLNDINPSLFLDVRLSEVLKRPLVSVDIRHTVGLSDPILPSDISNPVNDGLPHDLKGNIEKYGVEKLKIKLSGNQEADKIRLEKILSLSGNLVYTLDGNEFFTDVKAFEVYWEALNEILPKLSTGLIFVEQPFHRSMALKAKTARELKEWKGRPPIIIDESDCDLYSAQIAISAGYAGTSHKNCKGIFKSVYNACLMKQTGGILSGEDLCNVGPVALLQDLTVAAALGIEHIERNGHHYMKGLSMFPDDVQKEVMEQHSDLYEDTCGFPSLRIENGSISTVSVNRGFGPLFEIDTSNFIPLEDWRFDSLGLN